MLITTTPGIDGRRITRYCGVVAGEAILGANLFKDLFAGIRDLVGGRSATYEKELQRAREIALKELQERAAEMGANAVVGRWTWITKFSARTMECSWFRQAGQPSSSSSTTRLPRKGVSCHPMGVVRSG